MEDIVSFETALILKERGFDCPARKGYRENKELDSFTFNESRTNDSLNRDKLDRKDFISVAPTFYAAAKWLREKHKLRVFVTQGVSGNFNFEIYKPPVVPNQIGRWDRVENTASVNTYEEALEVGINKALT